MRTIYKSLKIDARKEILSKLVGKTIDEVHLTKFESFLPFINNLRNAANHAEQLYKQKRLAIPSETLKFVKSLNTHSAIIKTLLMLLPFNSITRSSICDFLTHNNSTKFKDFVTIKQINQNIWE